MLSEQQKKKKKKKKKERKKKEIRLASKLSNSPKGVLFLGLVVYYLLTYHHWAYSVDFVHKIIIQTNITVIQKSSAITIAK